jgi:hypothetical protein
MAEPVDPLMLQFLAWVASRPRTYADCMQAWQTTCPRHTVWEDALIDGLIKVASADTQHQSEVTLTPRGKAILEKTTDKSLQTELLRRA